jgi:superfamily II DNA/RNA helicase
VDIVIATPKRLSKLYFLNGINLTELQMIIVEDAEFMDRGEHHTIVNRISESMEKCQHIVFSETFSSKIKRLESLFMEVSEVIEAN